MKILYIMHIAVRVNNFCMSSLLAAKELGLEFHIACNWEYANEAERQAEEERYGIRIHQVDFSRFPVTWQNVKAYRQLRHIIQQEGIDFIHCNTPTGGLLGRLVGRFCKVRKTIYQPHGLHFFKGAPLQNWLLYYPAEKWLARFTDALITINQEDYALAHNHLPLRKGGKVYYVPGVGIDTNAHAEPEVNRAVLRARLGLQPRDIVLISAGRLEANKNNLTAIKALAKTTGTKLLLCGGGDELKQHQQQAEASGVRDRVYFLGYRDDIKDLYHAADIMLLVSFREGLPRSLMEAMACSLPCIASRIRGNVELIEDGVTGFLVSPTDVTLLAEKINILARHADMRSAMGKRGREKVEAFNLNIVTQYLKTIYQEVLLT